MHADMIARLDRVLARAWDRAGTMPAKEAVKVHPQDWHEIREIAITMREARALTADAGAQGEADWHDDVTTGAVEAIRERADRVVEAMRQTIMKGDAGAQGEAVRVCASESCGKPAKCFFERGGVGSWYCVNCAWEIERMAVAPPADPVREAARVRVRAFLREWARGTMRDGDIYGMHIGTDREAVLTVADLEALTALEDGQ